MVIIYTTCKNNDEAKAVGKELLTRRLAATINIWPIEAAYLAGDEYTEMPAVALLIKTLETRMQDIEDLILKTRHPAKPFIGVVNVFRVNREFKEKMSEIMK